MRFFAESLIAPAVLLAATSAGDWIGVPFGPFGISMEHILLLLYLCVLVFLKHNRTALELGFACLVAAIVGIIGALFTQLANAHLGSLVVLCMMFPLFIRYFENGANPQKVVAVAFVLITIQCAFFSNKLESYLTGWDYLVISGFGYIDRLAILGFVSNSLALMILPFFIYYLFLVQTRKEGRMLNLLLCGVAFFLICTTFSRTTIILVFIAITLLLNTKTLFVIAIMGAVVVIVDPYHIASLMYLAVNREQNLTESIRFIVWLKAMSDWDASDFLLGSGLQNPPLDNTYISIVIGAGFLGMITLFLFLFALVRWILCVSKKLRPASFRALVVVIITTLISANTYDIFSQRKILFGVALVIGALLGDKKNLYLRR